MFGPRVGGGRREVWPSHSCITRADGSGVKPVGAVEGLTPFPSALSHTVRWPDEGDEFVYLKAQGDMGTLGTFLRNRQIR